MSDGSVKWCGIPDDVKAKPHIRRVADRWVVDMGSLGFALVLFGCGPDNRGTWQDLLDWPGWRRT